MGGHKNVVTEKNAIESSTFSLRNKPGVHKTKMEEQILQKNDLYKVIFRQSGPNSVATQDVFAPTA
jgi:hypothetical protein